MTWMPMAAVGAALFVFVLVGLRARTAGDSLDDYLTARGSQGATTLGLSFVASGLGAWILFVPPEIGAFVGPLALAGYAVGAALPFLVLAWCAPALRRRLPAGRSLTDYAGQRFGPAVRGWVLLLSLLYMLCFLAAELTAIGSVVALLTGGAGRWAVLAVAVTTLAYTAWGGLRASLATDRWQAWLLLALLALVAAWLLGQPGAPAAAPGAPAGAPLPVALSVAATLVIAVTVANLFHQGYWQRIWAATDERALHRAAWLGALGSAAAVALVGTLGIVAAQRGLPLGSPPVPLFALVQPAPTFIVAGVLVLAVALVASSVDTLQNAIASLLVTQRAGATLAGARWATVLLMVPVVAIAWQGLSVLRLFLVADLLCATAAVPLLLGLWRRTPRHAALVGMAAGLLGAVLPDAWAAGSLWQGLVAATFPANVPTLAPFAGALVGSTAATLTLAWLAPLHAADAAR
ncbi:sss: transporter, solute:sodium symporter (SSS) family [Tepidimonas sediminis]|uniref:Sss: transporter, solute:sodium symporter (SSS) family n=1 Tax=Tepidimonas sediminis TaxID=2588941 RepID=A0A554WJY4_9BURK|nr:sodium:solute symporter [Tepidimonas sediminis]TSE23887.1 sss: transporter, solute:sodium symporter (SSS) family [Tepidimonas sediminis]